MKDDIKVVTICGSMRYSKEMMKVAKDLEIEGSIAGLQEQIDTIVGQEGLTGSLAALELRVKANEDSIASIEDKMGDVAEGTTLASLIASNAGSISTLQTTVGEHSTLLEGLRTDLNNEITRASEAESALTTAIENEVKRATDAEAVINGKINALHTVATSGMINDLAQKEDEELIFDCGNSGFVASV
jgi:hypothetical protein